MCCLIAKQSLGSLRVAAQGDSASVDQFVKPGDIQKSIKRMLTVLDEGGTKKRLKFVVLFCLMTQLTLFRL